MAILKYYEGSDYEIGRRHGEELKEEIHDGVIAHFNHAWNSHLNEQSLFNKPIIGKTVRKILDESYLKKLYSHVPEFVQSRVQGLVDGSGITLKEMITAYVLPDAVPILTATLGHVKKSLWVNPRMEFGCSSIVSNQDSRFLVARNLDFSGVGHWEKYPLLAVHHKPGKYKTLALTSAGVPMAGITGLNEKGIFVGLHQHHCRSVRVKGELPFVIGERILENAATLDEAKEILTSYNTSSSWAFIVADGKSKEAFVCEKQPRRIGFHELGTKKSLTHTNHFRHDATKRGEYVFSKRMEWDTYYRQKRLEQMITENSEPTVPQIIKMISDHVDPIYNEEKVFNRTVTMGHNILSVVVDFTNMKIYHAEGPTPVQHGQYREYDIQKLFDAQDGSSENFFEGATFENKKMQRARTEYIRSMTAFMDFNYQDAMSHIDSSIRSYDSAETRLVRGVLRNKMGEKNGNEDFREAISLIEKRGDQRPPEYDEAIRLLNYKKSFQHHIPTYGLYVPSF